VSSSFSSRGISRIPKEGEDREASSGIVSACHKLSHCHVAFGLILVTIAAVVPWWLFEISNRLRMFDEIHHLQIPGAADLPPSPAPDRMANFGIACGVIAILNAGILFRCCFGLRSFARTRRVVDLFPAVRRLRTTWFVFSISMLLVIGFLIYTFLTGYFALQMPNQ
jgi:hypothetical protein